VILAGTKDRIFVILQNFGNVVIVLDFADCSHINAPNYALEEVLDHTKALEVCSATATTISEADSIRNVGFYKEQPGVL
jgi:hypothetical protein